MGRSKLAYICSGATWPVSTMDGLLGSIYPKLLMGVDNVETKMLRLMCRCHSPDVSSCPIVLAIHLLLVAGPNMRSYHEHSDRTCIPWVPPPLRESPWMDDPPPPPPGSPWIWRFMGVAVLMRAPVIKPAWSQQRTTKTEMVPYILQSLARYRYWSRFPTQCQWQEYAVKF